MAHLMGWDFHFLPGNKEAKGTLGLPQGSASCDETRLCVPFIDIGGEEQGMLMGICDVYRAGVVSPVFAFISRITAVGGLMVSTIWVIKGTAWQRLTCGAHS